MNCEKCKSNRICAIQAKCSDCFSAEINGNEYEGYVLGGLGIGEGDYIGFFYCLNCGTMVGDFPLPETDLEKSLADEEVIEFYQNFCSERQKISPSTRWLLDPARKCSLKFVSFVDDLIEENIGRPFPSEAIFLKMFRDGDIYLDD